MNILPILLKDGYKVSHRVQYPVDCEYVYSNFTPRKNKLGTDFVIFFGLQYFVKEYLQKQFNENFFQRPKDEVLTAYKRRINNYLGKDASTFDHIAALHDLGYLPIRVKGLPEGTKVPRGIPVFTIVNTKPEFFWVTNMLETLLSNILWKPSTSATTAYQYRREFERYAALTGGPKEAITWQGHDFSFRGMSGIEDAMLSGAAHLLSFTGTDTIPAIDFLEQYYGADSDKELIGGSVPASEHSVMSMGLPEYEIDTFKRLITELYPTGIVSIVSDTWDLWQVIDSYLPTLKQEILVRNGRVVIRPDSGDPVKILCGDPTNNHPSIRKGVIARLWDIFDGTINDKGFKELNSHIGAIYGDSITLERQHQILESLKQQGFASTNVVLGIGSYTYEYATRDVCGFAMKATWGQTKSRGGINIFKDPKTDNSGKKSHKGRLAVGITSTRGIFCIEECTVEQEKTGLLQVVFEDGKLYNEQTLEQIRGRVEENLRKDLLNV